MQQTSRNLIAGVLNLVSGASAIIGSLILGGIGAISFGVMSSVPDRDVQAFAFVPALVFFPMALFIFITGVVAVVGGVAAIQQRRWWVALIGTVASIFSCFFLGIPAMILLIMGEPEFRRIT